MLMKDNKENDMIGGFTSLSIPDKVVRPPTIYLLS